MTDNKTKATDASVPAYLAARANAEQLADCRKLMAMFKKVTRKQPKMWGPSIVGYGSLHYTYPTGRSGDMPLAAFAIRGRELVVYVDVDDVEQQALLARLGKHKLGKVCLYFKRLSDLDQSVLEQLVANSIAQAQRRYA